MQEFDKLYVRVRVHISLVISGMLLYTACMRKMLLTVWCVLGALHNWVYASAADYLAEHLQALYDMPENEVREQVAECEYLAQLAQLTDAEFLAQFDSATESWLAVHLKEAESCYAEDKKDDWAKDREAFVAAAQNLRRAVHVFYDAQLAFAEQSVGELPDGEMVLVVQRALLRAHVVRDMNVLAAYYCCWLPGVESDFGVKGEVFVDRLSCVGRFTAELGVSGGKALALRLKEYELRRDVVKDILETMSEDYELISGCWRQASGDASPDDAAVAAFSAAEKAWQDYAEVLAQVHTPVWNFYFTGTGTGNLIQMMHIRLVDSHEMYLADLLAPRWPQVYRFVEEAYSPGTQVQVKFLKLQADAGLAEDAENAEDEEEEEE